MEQSSAWAIYEIDVTGEATGIVHYYDTLEHAQNALNRFSPYDSTRLASEHSGYSNPQLDSEFSPSTQCEWCGQEVL